MKSNIKVFVSAIICLATLCPPKIFAEKEQSGPARTYEEFPFSLRLQFGSIFNLTADAMVNSGNTRFEFFGGSARLLSKKVGLLDGKSLEESLRAKHGSMKEGGALLSNLVGGIRNSYKRIIHVSAVHTAGNPKKSLQPRE